MKLIEEVTFDSLGAIRKELNEWFGSDHSSVINKPASATSRDLLVSVLIQHLVEELTDVRVRKQIRAALAHLPHPRN